MGYVKWSDYCKNQHPTARREEQIQGLLENTPISNNNLIGSVYRALSINCETEVLAGLGVILHEK